MEGIKTDIEVIKVKLENMSLQIQRFISHLESEQRVTGNISKRVDLIEHTVNRMLDEKLKNESNSKWKIETIISLLALVLVVLSMFLK